MIILTGHLTATDKRNVKTIILNKWNYAKSGLKTYYLTQKDNVYTVKIEQKDRGLIPTPGSKLRLNTYTITLTT